MGGVKNITFSSCHDDIIPYLKPDWVYNTDTHEFYNGRYLCRPQFNVQVFDCKAQAWDLFREHHYLSGNLNKTSNCFMAMHNNLPVGFIAVLPMPGGTVKKAVREHRLVVLPDYQGMGIGNKLSDMIANAYKNAGYRYFSKTANPRMGEHRNKSELWKKTSKDGKNRADYLNMKNNYNNMLHGAMKHANRYCYSHEYIGTRDGGAATTKVVDSVAGQQLSLWEMAEPERADGNG